jgi:hypothetical protein
MIMDQSESCIDLSNAIPKDFVNGTGGKDHRADDPDIITKYGNTTY